jgi:hypothetical protein
MAKRFKCGILGASRIAAEWLIPAVDGALRA